MRGLDPEEKTFAWKMTQDMLGVGARQHRKGAHRECTRLTGKRIECNTLETLEHRLFLCESVKSSTKGVLQILGGLMGRDVDIKEVLCLNLTHRRKSTLILSIWFTVKSMIRIFNANCLTKQLLFKEIADEIKWHLDQNSSIGSVVDMKSLLETLE